MSDNRHLIALGDFRFSLGMAEYDLLRRTLNLRWGRSDVIGKRPSYQYVGVDDETITIVGAVYNYHQNVDIFDSPVMQTGVDQITQLREQALKGQPLRMVLETGQSLGYWIIVSITEAQTHFLSVAPLKQTYDLQLRFYGDSL